MNDCRRFLRVLTWILALAFVPALAGAAETITVVNPTSRALTAYPVKLQLEKLAGELGAGPVRVESESGGAVRSQADDLDGDGRADELVFLADLGPDSSRRFVLRAGRPPEVETDLGAAEGRVFSNRHLRCELSDEGVLSVLDRESGKMLVEELAFAPGRELLGTEVLAAGPIRIVWQQRRGGEEGRFDILQRTALYTNTRGLECEFVLRNQSGEEQKLPDLVDEDFVAGRQGELITTDWKNVEILIARFFLNNRNNLLWINPTTGYSMGMTPHSPHWVRYGAPLWATPVHKTMDGRMILADARHQWLVPGMPLSRVTGKGARSRLGGRIVLGGPRRLPDWQLDFEDKCWGKGRPKSRIILAPGEKRTYGVSFRFYRNEDPVQSIADYEGDIEAIGGLVNVYTAAGDVVEVAGAPVYMEEEFEDAGRWMASEAAEVRAEGGAAILSAGKPGAGISTALTRDFMDVTELRGEVKSLSEGARLQFSLRALRHGESHRIGSVDSAGTFRFNVSEAVPYRRPEPCVLEVRLSGSGGRAEAVLERLALAWVTPSAPELVSPEEDIALTDLAVSVGIMSRTPGRTEMGYRVQMARDPGFENPIMDEVFPSSMRICGGLHRDRTFLPTDLLPRGRYYCRVQGISPPDRAGEWSEVRRFEVDDTDHAPRPMRREVSRRRPMFIIPGRKPQSFYDFWSRVSPELQERMVSEVAYRQIVGEEAVRRWAEHGFDLLLKYYGHTAPDLSFLEKLGRSARELKGFYIGESGSGGDAMLRGLKLAAKYGLFAGNLGTGPGQLRWDATPEMHELMKTHGPYVLPLPKGQSPKHIGARYSPSIGLWLSGRIQFWGVETEWWAPYHLGIKDEEMAAIDWMPPFLYGLVTGAQAYRTETFIAHKKCCGWHPDRKEFGEVWLRAVGPFYRDILEEELIPGREQVLSKIKVAFESKPSYLTGIGYDDWPDEILHAAHGIEPGRMQWIPESSRLLNVPLLPPYVTAEEKAQFEVTVMPDEEFGSTEEVNAFLDRYYPRPASEAFAILVGDTGLATNTHPERAGDDEVEPQFYELALTRGPVKSISGEVDYHQYVILKQRDEGLFIHANNYAGQQTTFTLTGEDLEAWVEPAEAIARRQRRGEGLTLTLSHDHPAGATRVYVR